MNPNNRIQYLRKSRGLSQEELGEKMFVSRQTVSQWETGQTMPSIESLIKLREIFGVSVDEILGIMPEEREEKAEEQDQTESHFFKFEAEEVKGVLSFAVKPLKKRLFVISLFAAICFISIFGAEAGGNILFAVLFGVLVGYIIMYAKSILEGTRNIKNAVANIPGKTYTYAVSDGELIIKISEGERFISEEHRPLEEIENITDIEGHYIIVISGRGYIIRKEELKSDTKLFLYLKSHRKLTVMPTKKAEMWRTVSVVAVAASLLSVFFGLAATAAISAVSDNMVDFTDYMWAMLLFLPIPIFSIVLGFILKNKGIKYKKNIVVGIIMCCMLCIYGSFPAMFSDMNSALEIVRGEMNIEIPEYKNLNVYASESQKNHETMKDLYISEFLFTYESTAEFASTIDERWLAEFPSELREFAAADGEDFGADFCLLYNVDTKEYNTSPAKGGEYDIIFMMFSASDGQLYILKYRLIT